MKTLNTTLATAFHQQVVAAAPAGLFVHTFGSSTTGLVSATLGNANSQAACYSGTPEEVLEAVLAFPATDAFVRVDVDFTTRCGTL